MPDKSTFHAEPIPDLPPALAKAAKLLEELALHCTEHSILLVGAVGETGVHVVTASAGCCPYHVYATMESLVAGVEKNWGPVEQFGPATPKGCLN